MTNAFLVHLCCSNNHLTTPPLAYRLPRLPAEHQVPVKYAEAVGTQTLDAKIAPSNGRNNRGQYPAMIFGDASNQKFHLRMHTQ